MPTSLSGCMRLVSYDTDYLALQSEPPCRRWNFDMAHPAVRRKEWTPKRSRLIEREDISAIMHFDFLRSGSRQSERTGCERLTYQRYSLPIEIHKGRVHEIGMRRAF